MNGREVLHFAAILLAASCLTACADSAAKTTPSTPEPSPIAPAATPDATLAPDNYAAFGAILQRHQAMSARVARISRRLRVANAQLCENTRSDIGITTHRLADYPPDLHALALHYMPIGEEGRYVRSVVPGSPADVLEIRRGERVVSGWPADGTRPLVLDAGQGPFPLSIEPDTACNIPAHVVNTGTPNASTDGREIDLSTALIAQVGDDSALAFIIAHEMAHVLREHRAEDDLRWKAELQADADALVLMRNAGFDVNGTVERWEAGVEAHRETQALSATHPPLEIRLKALQDARARLAARPAGFLELEPDAG